MPLFLCQVAEGLLPSGICIREQMLWFRYHIWREFSRQVSGRGMIKTLPCFISVPRFLYDPALTKVSGRIHPCKRCFHWHGLYSFLSCWSALSFLPGGHLAAGWWTSSSAGSRGHGSLKELLTVQQFHGPSGRPQKAGGGGQAGSGHEQKALSSFQPCRTVYVFFSYFTGERSRVWEGDTGNIAYDLGSHGHTSGGLKAACVWRLLAQSLGIVQNFRHVPPYAEPESSPGAITNQSDSTKSGAIYGTLSVFSCDSWMLSLVHPGSEPYQFALKYSFPRFSNLLFSQRNVCSWRVALLLFYHTENRLTHWVLVASGRWPAA